MGGALEDPTLAPLKLLDHALPTAGGHSRVHDLDGYIMAPCSVSCPEHCTEPAFAHKLRVLQFLTAHERGRGTIWPERGFSSSGGPPSGSEHLLVLMADPARGQRAQPPSAARLAPSFVFCLSKGAL